MQPEAEVYVIVAKHGVLIPPTLVQRPVPEPTDTHPGLLLLQVPPEQVVDRVNELPAHMVWVAGPVIGHAAFTLTGTITEQPPSE